MSSIDVLTAFVENYACEFDTVLLDAIVEGVEALEKVGQVQAIRDRVSLINTKAQKHGDLTFECLLAFIDSLDK